jgi:DnaJ-class molecular chaperone
MSEQQPQPCTSCGGAGGRTVDTSSGGVSRQHWQTCQPCRGTGTR